MQEFIEAFVLISYLTIDGDLFAYIYTWNLASNFVSCVPRPIRAMVIKR